MPTITRTLRQMHAEAVQAEKDTARHAHPIKATRLSERILSIEAVAERLGVSLDDAPADDYEAPEVTMQRVQASVHRVRSKFKETDR